MAGDEAAFLRTEKQQRADKIAWRLTAGQGAQSGDRLETFVGHEVSGTFRIGQTGGQGIDANAMSAGFAGQGAGKADDARFRGHILGH